MRRRPTFTRADRISSLMQDEVKRIIEFELTSPLARHIQVTDTKLAADMGHLRIRFVMKERPLTPTGEVEPITEDEQGDEHGSAEKAQLMLDRSAGYVARVLCEVLQLRKAPKIVFSYDREYAQMKRVREILEEERGGPLLLPADASVTVAPAMSLNSTDDEAPTVNDATDAADESASSPADTLTTGE